MSTVIHPRSQYNRIKREMTEKDLECSREYVRICMTLDRFGPELMASSELQVMRFILGRTYSYGKRAEVIGFEEFIKGIVGVKGRVTSGTGLGKNTVRKAFEGLHAKDLMTVHAFRGDSGEVNRRIYSPNIGKILVYSIFENEDLPLPEFGSPPSQELVVISKEYISKESSTNVDVSAAPTGQVKRRAVGMARQIEVDCKTKPAIEDMISGIRDQYATKRASRVESNKVLPKRPWPTKDIQALLDKARDNAEADGYKTPRVVAIQKCISTLHQRLVKHEVADPLDFLTWALKNWEMVASSNRRAKARQVKQTQAAKSEMSMAPNFRDLAYLAPYFITIYNDREQLAINEERGKVEQQVKVETVRKASSSYLEAKKEQTRIEDLAREAARAKDNAPIRRMRKPATPVEFSDTDEAPRFRSRFTEN
jgi:hypothetical protein